MTGQQRDAAGPEVSIRVPASSANLGPGYDSFGLALAKYDEITARRVESGLRITVDGIGAGSVPTDASHLVIQAMTRTFRAAGETVPGLEMHCYNTIPHGGGQGSSAAAIVSGVILARELSVGGAAQLSDNDVFAIASEMEGHPDNVAPALFGGFTIAWMAASEWIPAGMAGMTTFSARRPARAVKLTPHPDIQVLILTAEASCATSQARAALPDRIPHGDAAANSARAALLAHAMTTDPSLLFDATEDWLHQRYREAVMPQSADLLHRLRSEGLAAVLSGAGPAVLVLGTDLPLPDTVREPGFAAELVAIPAGGVVVNGTPFRPPQTPVVANSGTSPVA